MLYALCPWGFEVDQIRFLRSRWTVVESLRRHVKPIGRFFLHLADSQSLRHALTSHRIGALLYLIDLLLNSSARSPSKGHCDEFFDMPLPCVRELWQPISDREWNQRYQEDFAAKRLKGGCNLSLRNLLRLRQPSIVCLPTAATHDLAEEFAEWCERADDLSMLLWMSLMVEGDGRAGTLGNP